MNPVIQHEPRLNDDHYVVELMGEERRAFSLNRDDVYRRRVRLAQNFCLILFDSLSDHYFVIPFQVLANTLTDKFMSTSQPLASHRNWTGTIAENKTMCLDSGECVQIGSCYKNEKLLQWLITGHDVFSFNDVDIDEKAEGWPTYSPFGLIVSSNDHDSLVDMEDARKDILQNLKSRPGQSQFKADLYARYGEGCMVTDCRIDGLVEAAHIIPYRVNADHHPSNGLLLRADIHTLFDMHLLGIQPETLEVSLHPVAERDGYGYVRGKRLRFLTQLRPSSQSLGVRWRWFNDHLRSSRSL